MLKRLLGSPEGLLVCSFALVILVGTVALRLPISHESGQSVGWLDAWFISTSAVCVTGLATVDPAITFSRFGHIVLMTLIQIGGLGILTFSALAAQMLAFRVSFGSHALLQDVFFQSEARGNLRRALSAILLTTFGIELIGAVLLHVGMQQYDHPPGGVFEALFLAISAFCNAGFSLYSDSVMSFRESPLILGVIMGLIVLGGLGYTVLIESAQRAAARKRRGAGPVRWSLNSRLVLWVSAALVFGGAAGIAGTGLTADENTAGEFVLHSLFQSVTARTAGFNSVDIAALPTASLMLLIALMFIGGSPGSCAGGIKTTAVAVWTADVRAHLEGRRDVTLLGRRLPTDVVRRAGMVFGLAALWVALGSLLLAISERVGPSGVRLEDVIFEQVSAFGTVGLSTGLTPQLSDFGKFWIIASMFVGRVGPLTVALLVVRSETPTPYSYPSERVMIG